VGGDDNWGQVKKVVASDAAADDGFGLSLAIGGDTLVVGAPLDDDVASGSGVVYVFQRDAGGGDNWGEVKKLVAADAASGDEFGFSVAIHGDTIAVGAPFDDDAGSETGSVYIFERDLGGGDNWGQAKKLTADDATASDQLGYAVSISMNTLIAGAPGSGEGTGSAYLFERGLGGAGNWGQVTRLRAGDAEIGGEFGFAVSIDQDTTLVGARFVTGLILVNRPPAPNDPTPDPNEIELDDAGAAYFFERNTGGTEAWGQVQKHTAANAQAGDQFGFAVAVYGDRAVVGSVFARLNHAGAAYVLDRDRGGNNAWGTLERLIASDARTLDEYGFGVSLGLNAVAVGAPENDAECPDDRGCNSGSTYVYAMTQTTDQQACINALNVSFARVSGAHARLFARCVKNYARTGASADACLMASNRAVANAERRTFRQEALRCADSTPDFGSTDAATANDAAMQLEVDVVGDIFGPDLDAALAMMSADKDAARCQSGVVNSVNRCQREMLKAFNHCKKNGLKNAILHTAADLEGCIGADPRGVVARACDATTGTLATRVLPRKCTSRGVDLSDAFPGCGTDAPEGVSMCVEASVACEVCAAINSADDLAVDCDLFDDGAVNSSCL
jgi:hypothetical protein